MRRLARLLLVCLLGAAATAGPAGAAAPVSIGAGLKGPSGLRATVYATGLAHVSAFALDGQGRLWATTSAAENHATDGVYLVRGAGATPVKVISGLKGPLGLVWSGGTLYVASIGQVDAFSGLSGTRFADRRRVLTETSGHGWNQGLVLAPNGRFVMSIAAPCDHCLPASRYAGTIISFATDGSKVQTYAAHIRAAFGLAFYPGTSTLFASMNQRDDLGTKTPGDTLAIVRAGSDWRSPGCYDQGGSACSGVPAVLATLDKHAAAGGVAFASGTLGSALRDAALVSEWEFGKLLAVPLTISGSKITAGRPVTAITGFRSPLPLLRTASGALLVGDWATGRIVRIVRSS
jgi:glucose/arabinose dehydrogenase